MKEHLINYDTLLEVTRAMSMSREPETVIRMTVESIRRVPEVKGCALFLVNWDTHELELAASSGLSREYQEKGPVSVLKSIAGSLKEGPVAIYDATNDIRIQYPGAARKEGIASILSVPIFVRGRSVGAMRVYTAQHWNFLQDDINLFQALAQMAGIIIDMCRLYRGYQECIDVFNLERDGSTIGKTAG